MSIVAWIGVILTHAIVHYLILGNRRRERFQEEEDSMVMEESLSLTTTDGSMDSDELMIGDAISSSLHGGECYTKQGSVIPGAPLAPPLLGDDNKLSADENEKVFMEFLGQTGKELFRVSLCGLCVCDTDENSSRLRLAQRKLFIPWFANV